MSETEGERLGLLRQALGGRPGRPLSQPKLAELIGYDASTISRIELGKLKMSREFAEEAAKHDPLKRGPWWLLYGIVTINGEAPAETQAEADENLRRLQAGEPLITRSRSSRELPDEAHISATSRLQERDEGHRGRRATGGSRDTADESAHAPRSKRRPRPRG